MGKPSLSTTVFGRLTRIGALRSYTPGVRIRSFPRASAASMARMDVLGVAMKNLLIGIALPAVPPPAQDGPDELCWRAGTNTLSAPVAPVCRKGSSCVAGLVASVV